MEVVLVMVLVEEVVVWKLWRVWFVVVEVVEEVHSVVGAVVVVVAAAVFAVGYSLSFRYCIPLKEAKCA